MADTKDIELYQQAQAQLVELGQYWSTGPKSWHPPVKLDINFAKAFDALVRQINPVIPRIKKIFSKGYYWVLDQGGYATDVMFKERQSLLEICPELVEHDLVNFNASDVIICCRTTQRLCKRTGATRSTCSGWTEPVFRI
ncbi:MAG: hypothetical protein NG747_16045 [Candidatus Brocadia sp.]|nr:hypothetical protein [Candidatus Brocadia sp.]